LGWLSLIIPLTVKRKITIVVLLATGIVLGYLSFITWSVGFLLARYLSNKTSSESHRLLQSRIIPLGKYRIHLHHWLWSSCAIVAFAVFKGAYVLPSNLFYGFFGAIVFHGIYYYSDWCRVLIPRRVQSLVVTKNLAIGTIAAAINFPETRKKMESEQSSLRICPPPSHYCISQIVNTGSKQDRGIHKNTA